MSPESSLPFAQPWVARDALRITRVRTIVTAPDGDTLVIVRVDTNDPGLYGLGCATFTQRWKSVVSFVTDYLDPLVTGRYPGDIEDVVRLARLAGYWRDGGIEGNAVSGLDMALWDIAGKRAGMPVHELIGGKVRAAADTYLHAGGASIDATIEHAQELMAIGQRHVRLQVGQAGAGSYGAPAIVDLVPGVPYPDAWERGRYLRNTVELFERSRAALGEEVELLHDCHSRLDPKQAVVLARSLEAYRLFFLEDVLAPEIWDRLPEVRRDSPLPIAVGELATSATTAAGLIRGGAVDFIRCHISAIGGFTPARKLAALAEFCGVRTAWHAPGDLSPIGAAANVALDVTSSAFGIQEGHVYNDAAREVFPGTLLIENGWLTPHEEPGWGIDLDERLAAKFPPIDSDHDGWASQNRGLDGGLNYP